MVAGGGLLTLGPWAGRVRRKLQASRRPLFPGRAGIAARTTWARAAGPPAQPAPAPSRLHSVRRRGPLLAARQRSLNLPRALRIQTHGHARPIQSENSARHPPGQGGMAAPWRWWWVNSMGKEVVSAERGR